MQFRAVLAAGILPAVAAVIHLGTLTARADEPNWLPDQKCVNTADLCAVAAPCLSHGAQCNTCTHAGRFHQECRPGGGRKCSEPRLAGGSGNGCGNLVQRVCVNFGSSEEPDPHCVGSIILADECMRYVCDTHPDPGA